MVISRHMFFEDGEYAKLTPEQRQQLYEICQDWKKQQKKGSSKVNQSKTEQKKSWGDESSYSESESDDEDDHSASGSVHF